MGTNASDVPDTDALQAQLEQCHEAAFGWALCCCKGNRMEAEEVLQTTYLKVLERAAHYRGRSAFKTWLFAVIRKTACDRRRSTLLRRLRLVRNASYAVAVEQPTGLEDRIQRLQILLRFQQALWELPRRQREVLALVFAQDLTLRESARVLGITLGSARRHYERGKQRLRQLLADLEESDAI